VRAHRLASILLFLLPVPLPACAAPAGRPNILLILADDLGWTGLGSHGSDLHETPHLDRLASEGVRFTQAYAASPVCTPTRAAILTGKAPARLHMTIWREASGEAPPHQRRELVPPVTERDLPLAETTIAELLHAAGYFTAHVGKWHLGDAGHYPEAHGFEVNVGGTIWGAPATYFWPFRGPFGVEKETRYVPGLGPGKEGDYLTDRLTDAAIETIERAHAARRPFYLNLWYHDVHSPLDGKPDLVAHYARKIAAYRGAPLAHDNAAYAAMHHALDQNVGRVLAKLEALGIARDTIVIFTSDNGGYVNEHRGRQVTRNTPLRSGKGSLYEGGIRVPLLVRWPGVTRAGAVCREPVIATDLFATIREMAGLDAAGAREEAPADGRSLAPLIREPSGTLGRDALFFHYPHYYETTAPVSAVRAGSWKLLEYHLDGRVELYDLEKDIGETRDLAREMPERARELQARLDAWRAAVGAQMPSRNPAPTGGGGG
jgi:arylsulfatase A-like enzyme